MRVRIQFLLAICFSLILTSTILAQSGKIAGKITDEMTGEPLPFVNIIIMGTNYGAASDLDGEYFIINVTPGTFSVKASAIGYNSVTYQNISVATGFTTNLDFKLKEEAFELGDVIVIADKPLIRKDITATTSTIGEDMISSLPVTELSDVLQLQAGVVQSGADFHIRGGRRGQTAFQIDGIPLTDAYDGSAVINVSANAVQELQVISGAFNAEYGQAMSGIINIVTKDGSNTFTGNVQSYVGDYVSSKKERYWNIDNINPLAIRNVEGSLSGPIIKDKLYFFTNARHYYNTGYLYGKRTFLVTDRASEVPGSGGTNFNFTKNGDSSFVPMNTNERLYGQGKLTYILTPGVKLSYNFITDRHQYKDYNHGNRLTPDNNPIRKRVGYTNQLTLNHVVANSSFYNLNFAYFFKDYNQYLFENIYTGEAGYPTFYVDNNTRQTPPYSFTVGGTDYNRFRRFTSTYSAKLDWVTQLNQEISLQFGGEYKRHELYYHSINLFPYYDNNIFNVGVSPLTTTSHDEYLRKPSEASGYLQSKLEAFNLIFNVGVRFDIFDPAGIVLADPTDPNIINPLKPSNRFYDNNLNGVYEPELGETEKTVEERRAYWYKDATVKYQFSPRVGIAFPITDKGVIHFSYGHFLQLPSYEYLYTNPDFELGVGSGNQGLFGNADLKPQQTVKGEIGLQQQIGDDIAIDVTMFFEDFRNLTGTQTEEVLVFNKSASYSVYANSDFGFSKGVIFKFEKRFGGGLAVNLDYTYSVTKGNASNPADARDALAGGALPETFIAPLNWDQSHTLNLAVSYAKARDYGFSVIANFYSGQPYTPSVNKNTRVTQNAFPRNSEIKPSIVNIDLRAYKDFVLWNNFTLTAFVKVFNLLDFDNPTGVYSETGDPTFTFNQLDAEKIKPKLYYNTLDQLFVNPGFFSEPRRVELGLSFNF